MKKTLSLILAVVMLLGCMSITAFAEDKTDIKGEIKDSDFSYEIVIPSTTTLTETNHTDVQLGGETGKATISNVKHPTDKTDVCYTVDLTNGNLNDGTTTIDATYKYKQGGNEFAPIVSNTTKVTVYSNATVTDSFLNVTADETDWAAAPAGDYTASVTFNFFVQKPWEVSFDDQSFETNYSATEPKYVTFEEAEVEGDGVTIRYEIDGDSDYFAIADAASPVLTVKANTPKSTYIVPVKVTVAEDATHKETTVTAELTVTVSSKVTFVAIVTDEYGSTDDNDWWICGTDAQGTTYRSGDSYSLPDVIPVISQDGKTITFGDVCITGKNEFNHSAFDKFEYDSATKTVTMYGHNEDN